MTRAGSSIGDHIEFLVPNEAAFGMADLADFVGFDGDDEQMFGDDGPRSKWLPLVASVVVCGFLGGGIIAAAPWDQDSTAPAPSTTGATAPATTVSSTTLASPTTTERVLDVASFGPPGYVFDEPGVFQLVGGWTSGDFRPTFDDWFEAWATPEATRTSGQWLVAATMLSRVDAGAIRAGGVRIEVGSGIGVVSSAADGVIALSFTTSDQTPLEIQSFGFGLDELLAMADQISLGPGNRLQFGTTDSDSATDGPEGPTAGLQQVVSARIGGDGLEVYNLLSQPDSDVFYVDDQYRQTIDIRRSASTPVDTVVRRLMLQPVTDLSLDDQAELDDLARGGVRYDLRSIPGRPDMLVATVLGRVPITLWSNRVDVSTLIGMLTEVRRADEPEWADLIDRTMNGDIIFDGPDSFEPPTVIGRFRRDTDTDGQYGPLWTIQMQIGDAPYITIFTDQSAWSDAIGGIPMEPTVRRFASASTTFFVATVTPASDARQIRVTIDGLAPVDVPMVPVGPMPVFAAGFAFTELADATVEFLDVDGNTVDGNTVDGNTVEG